MGWKPLEAPSMKFEAGEIVITPAASAALEACGQYLEDLLLRHCGGDWGEINEQVRTVNERGMVERFNLQSCYMLSNGQRLVVVTNAGRTLTMIHLDPCGE